MIASGDARVTTLYRRLSTGMKMLFWLFAALLPLGLVAIFASIYSARDYRANREIETRTIASESAAKLTAMIARTTLALRINTAAIARDPAQIAACRDALEQLAAAQQPGLRYAFLTATGRRVCATPGFRPEPPVLIVGPGGYQIDMLDDGSAVTIDVSDSTGGIVSVVDIPRAALAAVARPPSLDPGSFGIILWQDNQAMTLAEVDGESPLGQRITTDAPLGDTTLSLQVAILGSPVRAIEILMVLLPILMWIAAATIGWLVVDRLLLRPLGLLHDKVVAYGRDQTSFALPDIDTPAQEIQKLGEAFLLVTQTVARHEGQLEEGLARQTQLTREVHHRVKNNLQVVASLINLHARGTTNPEVAAAYASIQRRVDALAVVHRNHFAELEENRGVALRPLIGELAANLRATAGPEHAAIAIALDVAAVYVTQDIAVPIAFLITELVELAMLTDPRAAITIRLGVKPEPGRAALHVQSPALVASDALAAHLERRFGRVVTGLSRQLRSKLDRDEAEGTFCVDLPIVV